MSRTRPAGRRAGREVRVAKRPHFRISAEFPDALRSRSAHRFFTMIKVAFTSKSKDQNLVVSDPGNSSEIRLARAAAKRHTAARQNTETGRAPRAPKISGKTLRATKRRERQSAAKQNASLYACLQRSLLLYTTALIRAPRFRRNFHRIKSLPVV